MTILICIPCLMIGGTEIQTLHLVQALVSGGHQVVTACYFEYTREMVERYKAAGSEVVLFEPTRKRIGGWRGVLFLYRHLRQCVRKYKPDIAHVQYMAPGATPCLILKLLGVRTIFATAHTDARIYRSLRLLHFLQRQVIDVFTCITLRAEREFFGSSLLYKEDIKLPPHAHITIYNALSEHLEPRRTERSLSASPTIGVAGRLEHIKGMDLVLPAFAWLRDQIPDAKLLVVGDGSLRERMRRQAEELHVQDSVEWAGRQLQEQLAAFYDRMDLFWMPSRSEGFGLSALEAMARGCPVIASDVGGLPELIWDGGGGLLVPMGDREALAIQSLEVLSSTERWQQMSRAARVRAAEFSMERFSRLMNNLYHQTLKCLY